MILTHHPGQSGPFGLRPAGAQTPLAYVLVAGLLALGAGFVASLPVAGVLVVAAAALGGILWLSVTPAGPVLPLLLALLVPVAAAADPVRLGLPLGPLLAVALLALAVHQWQRAGRPHNGLFATALVLLGAGAVVGVATSPETSILPALTLLVFWLAGYLAGAAAGRLPNADKFIAWAAIPIALLAISEVAGFSFAWVSHFGAPLYEVPADQTRTVATFGHPLFAGGAFAMLGLLAIGSSTRFRSVAAPLYFIAAATTVSRSALIGIAVGFAVLALQSGARRRVVIGVLAASGVAIVSAFLFSPALQETFYTRAISSPATEAARQGSLDAISTDLSSSPQTLILGDGLRSSERRFVEQGSNFGVNTFDNQYITLTYEVGLLFLIPCALLLAVAVLRSGSPAAGAVASGAVLLAFSNGLNWPSTSVLLWFSLGLCAVGWNARVAAAPLRIGRAGEVGPGR